MTRLLLLALFAEVHAVAADESTMTPRPAERYATMAQKSPFALATAVAAPEAPQASFAANWYISGMGRLGDTDFVSIKSRDATLQFSLFGHEAYAGVSVASIDWSETVGKSTVVLQKGTEMAKLEWNEAELHGPPPTATNPANPGNPANLKNQNPISVSGAGAHTPGLAPGSPYPNNAMRPGMVAPRAPVTVTPLPNGQPKFPFPTTAPAGTPGAPGAVGEVRRRLRPIPAPGTP